MTTQFADLRRRCSGSSSEMLVRMFGNHVHHTRLRHRLASLANAIVYLETVPSGQASVLMTKLASFRHKPLLDMGPASADEFHT